MFPIPFSYFKYAENFFRQHLYRGFSLKVFEKYKLMTISVWIGCSLLFGFYWLEPVLWNQSTWLLRLSGTRSRQVWQVVKEAGLQVCFQSLLGIKVKVIWVSQSNFKTASGLRKRGKCAPPHYGGVGRTWCPGEILAYEPSQSVYGSKSWASVCSLRPHGPTWSEGGQSFRDERVPLPGELGRDSAVLWRHKDRLGTWSGRTQFWEPYTVAVYYESSFEKAGSKVDTGIRLRSQMSCVHIFPDMWPGRVTYLLCAWDFSPVKWEQH